MFDCFKSKVFLFFAWMFKVDFCVYVNDLLSFNYITAYIQVYSTQEND